MSAHIDTTALDGLRANFGGELLTAADGGYDQARKIWNGHIDRRPALIAGCTGVADVIAAVRFARQLELPAAVRGGGHAVAGHALCDDGLVIDLSPMRGTRLDLLASTIRAQGGCLYEHLDRESQALVPRNVQDTRDSSPRSEACQKGAGCLRQDGAHAPGF